MIITRLSELSQDERDALADTMGNPAAIERGIDLAMQIDKLFDGVPVAAVHHALAIATGVFFSTAPTETRELGMRLYWQLFTSIARRADEPEKTP